MAIIPVGTRIAYTTHTGATVLGKVIPAPAGALQNTVWMRVTSKDARYYSPGMKIPVSRAFLRVIK